MTVRTAPEEFRAQLWNDGLLCRRNARFTPFTDGVSSEIYRVDDGDDSFVVKRALPRLSVQDEWIANVDRNRYEQLYIEYVGRIAPGSVPVLRAGSSKNGYFAMELLGAGFESWKARLLRGDARTEDASQAGQFLGRVHACSAEDPAAREQFDTSANFDQLRVDPYLIATASRHPDLAAAFHAEAERLLHTRESLVHGDFSPKNLMISSERMVVLDCEVAWYGDPAFDIAFLLTHLLLKGLLHAPREIGLPALVEAFLQCYFEKIRGKLDHAVVERRAARLLPMLILARKDGKSPVEYLEDPARSNWLREFARKNIQQEPSTLEEVYSPWFQNLGQFRMQSQ